MNKEYLAREFLYHVNRNYNSIKESFMKQSTLYSDDALQESILRVYSNIEKKGFSFNDGIFSGDCFNNYLFFAFKNQTLIEKEKDNKFDLNQSTPVSNKYNEEEFETDDQLENETLIYNQEEIMDDQLLKIKEDFLIDQIFDYVERNFTPLQAGFFKFYYRNKISYKKIAFITKFSVTYIFHNVDEVRKAVLKEFKNEVLEKRIKKKRNLK